MRLLISLAAIILFAGCAGKFKSTVSFNPTEPLRVAVLPFIRIDSKGNVIEKEDASLLIDEVSLVSEKLKKTPADYMHDLVQRELAKTGLDLIPPVIVNAELSHHGFSKPDLSLDLKKLYEATPKDICTHLLQCDAVLYGKVTSWDRAYLAIQSVAEVGIDLKLVSASDGKILFESDSKDTVSRGITKLPTGYSSLVIAPIEGLGNDLITNLARELVGKTLLPLTKYSQPSTIEKPPPAILAAAIDSQNGILQAGGEPLSVLALGSPGAKATFSISGVVSNVPMIEREGGRYFGEYYPLGTDYFSNEPISVSLSDEFGRVTTKRVGTRTVTVARKK